jgi:hypothetical protein
VCCINDKIILLVVAEVPIDSLLEVLIEVECACVCLNMLLPSSANNWLRENLFLYYYANELNA